MEIKERIKERMNDKDKLEILSSSLAFITVIMTVLNIYKYIDIEHSLLLKTVDVIISIYFILEYVLRLYKAPRKFLFIRNNKLDFLAIIPFNQMFKIFRIFKILRINKFKKYINFIKKITLFDYFSNKIDEFLESNNFIYILYICLGMLFGGATGLYLLEKGTTVNTFGDALWWAIVTTTTVGYGDISPSTVSGRLIGGFLMLGGIGTISMLTGTISTYFLKNNRNIIEDDESILKIKESKDLTEEEKEEITEYIKYIKSKRDK